MQQFTRSDTGELQKSCGELNTPPQTTDLFVRPYRSRDAVANVESHRSLRRSLISILVAWALERTGQVGAVPGGFEVGGRRCSSVCFFQFSLL